MTRQEWSAEFRRRVAVMLLVHGWAERKTPDFRRMPHCDCSRCGFAPPSVYPSLCP